MTHCCPMLTPPVSGFPVLSPSLPQPEKPRPPEPEAPQVDLRVQESHFTDEKAEVHGTNLRGTQ